MPYIPFNCRDKRVLVAEDNAVNRKVVLAMLAKFQVNADFAENGQAALDLLAKQAYHLVLMDCHMPVMDGYEATRIHRSRESGLENVRRMPIVALTADTAVLTQQVCLTAGMDDFLSKPIDYQALSDMLSKWLNSDQQHCKISPQPTEPALQPKIDNVSVCWDEAAVLNFVENDEELLLELIRLFIESAPEQLLKINQALQHNDLDTIAHVAHAIKSMVMNFYAESAQSLASRLERQARHGESVELAGLTSELNKAVMQLISSLQQRIKVKP